MHKLIQTIIQKKAVNMKSFLFLFFIIKYSLSNNLIKNGDFQTHPNYNKTCSIICLGKEVFKYVQLPAGNDWYATNGGNLQFRNKLIPPSNTETSVIDLYGTSPQTICQNISFMKINFFYSFTFNYIKADLYSCGSVIALWNGNMINGSNLQTCDANSHNFSTIIISSLTQNQICFSGNTSSSMNTIYGPMIDNVTLTQYTPPCNLSNCILCELNNSLTCRICQVNFLKINQICIKCNLYINNCITCNISNNTCLACQDNYTLNQNHTACLIIYNCDVLNCQTCLENSSTICSVCLTNYRLNQNLTCCDIICNVSNCQTCIINSFNLCSVCQTNYILNQNSTECFLLNNNSICNISNCQTCIQNQSNLCSECQQNYTLSEDYTCDFICNVPFCQKCIQGFSQICQICISSPTFFLNLQNNSQCKLCNQYVSNCLNCSDSLNCLTCQSNYQISINEIGNFICQQIVEENNNTSINTTNSTNNNNTTNNTTINTTNTPTNNSNIAQIQDVYIEFNTFLKQSDTIDNQIILTTNLNTIQIILAGYTPEDLQYFSVWYDNQIQSIIQTRVNQQHCAQIVIQLSRYYSQKAPVQVLFQKEPPVVFGKRYYFRTIVNGHPISMQFTEQQLNFLAACDEVSAPVMKTLDIGLKGMKTVGLGFFVYSLFNYLNLMILYNFLSIRQPKSFKLFSEKLLVQVNFFGVFDMLGIDQQVFSLTEQFQITQKLQYSQTSWSGPRQIGFSSNFFRNNIESFFILGIVSLKLLIFTIIFKVFKWKLFNIENKKIQLMITEFNSFMPIFILPAVNILIEDISYLQIQQKINTCLQIAILFICMIIPFIYYISSNLRINEEKQIMLRLIQIQKKTILNQNKIQEHQNFQKIIKKFQFAQKEINQEKKKQFFETLIDLFQNFMLISIPSLIMIKSVIPFLIINGILVIYRFILIIKLRKNFGIFRLIYFIITRSIWLIYHFSFIIFLAIQHFNVNININNQSIEQYLDESLKYMGFLLIILVSVGGVLQILEVLIGILFQIKQILINWWRYIKEKINASSAQIYNCNKSQKNKDNQIKQQDYSNINSFSIFNRVTQKKLSKKINFNQRTNLNDKSNHQKKSTKQTLKKIKKKVKFQVNQQFQNTVKKINFVDKCKQDQSQNSLQLSQGHSPKQKFSHSQKQKKKQNLHVESCIPYSKQKCVSSQSQFSYQRNLKTDKEILIQHNTRFDRLQNKYSQNKILGKFKSLTNFKKTKDINYSKQMKKGSILIIHKRLQISS